MRQVMGTRCLEISATRMISFRGYGTTSGIRPLSPRDHTDRGFIGDENASCAPASSGSGAMPEYRIYIIGPDGDFMQSEPIERAKFGSISLLAPARYWTSMERHKLYISEHGDDMPEVRDWRWSA
jgi:hypothetical protein